MPYVTGGYATGPKVTWNFLTAAGTVTEGADTKHHGGYLGGGVDWMAPNGMLGAEYRHYSFNSQTAVPLTLTPGGIPVTGDTYTVKPKVDSVVVRLSYLFGWFR